MAINILMPALSPTMTEGKLSAWLVKEGDTIKAGDVIAEIETDKATMEVEAVDEGTIAKIVVAAGTENVQVNSLIAVIAEEGEDTAAVAAKGGQGTAAPAAAPAPVPAAAAPAATPVAAPVPAAAPVTSRIFASPLARRIAKDGQLDLATVTGTGPHGRIVKADVEAALKAGPVAKPAAAPVAAPVAAAPAPAPKAEAPASALPFPFPEGSYELVPNDGMRKAIARRLLESKQTVPHFYLSIDVELDKLLALRAQVNEQASVKVSVNDFIIKASALALKKVPAANATWTEPAVIRHKHADIAVAVAIDGGLITPIVFKAEQKSLTTIAASMKDLAERARARKLKPEEFQGGTFSISNLGMFGIKDFAAIVNPPHGAILAVGAGEKRPVVKNGELAIATVMTVTLSSDHRVVDGAVGAEFLAAFKALIENPLTVLI